MSRVGLAEVGCENEARTAVLRLSAKNYVFQIEFLSFMRYVAKLLKEPSKFNCITHLG